MPDVSVATLNVLNGAHTRWDDRLPLIVSQLAAIAPDVIGLQEMDRAGVRAEAIANRANEALGEQRYRVHTLANPAPDSIKSLAVLTRFPALSEDRADLETGDIAFRVELQVAAGVSVDFVTTHFLYRPTSEGGEIRLRQAAQVLEWLRPRLPGPAILTGDFNARPGGRAVSALKGVFRSAHEAVHGTEPHRTQPTPLARALDAEKAFGVAAVDLERADAIDYIFVSEGITVLDAAVCFDEPSRDDPPLFASDHFGLRARLRITG